MSGGREHEFTLALQGAFDELTDEMANRLYEAGCDDALVSTTGGRAFLDFTREAPAMKDAIVSAIQNVRLAGYEVDRIATCELVTKADIARRLGRSRQRVTQWTSGESGHKGFPPPACQITDGHSLWRWCEVAHWAYENSLVKKEVWQAAEDIDLVNSILTYCNRSKASGEEFTQIVELLYGGGGCKACAERADGQP